MFCGVILAALSGCIRIEQNQPTTTQSYQPSGFRYHTGTSSYTRQTVSETDSTQLVYAGAKTAAARVLNRT